jgi:hypothetical protein
LGSKKIYKFLVKENIALFASINVRRNKEKFTLKLNGAWNKFLESSNGTEVLNFVGQRLKIYSWLCINLLLLFITLGL